MRARSFTSGLAAAMAITAILAVPASAGLPGQAGTRTFVINQPLLVTAPYKALLTTVTESPSGLTVNVVLSAPTTFGPTEGRNLGCPDPATQNPAITTLTVRTFANGDVNRGVQDYMATDSFCLHRPDLTFPLLAAGASMNLSATFPVTNVGTFTIRWLDGAFGGGGPFTVGSTTGAPPPSPATPARPLPPAFGSRGVFSLPSNRSCVSRRHFRIRIRRQRAGVTLISAAVAVDGKRVAVRKGRRLTAPVDLRGLPRGRFTVRISALTSDGRAVSGSRRYRTCTTKAPSNGPGPV